MSGDMEFSVVCSLFNWMQKSKLLAKRSKFRKFLDTYCKPSDYFSAIRLVLPKLDRERGTYGLQEYVLATCLIDALGMSRESEDAVLLFNWRKGGSKTGANAGNFAMVAAEVLQRRQGMISGGLTINELNDFLDRLASSENRTDKTAVLSSLISRTNAQEMKWILMIILKDLKLGISEKSIFHEFHIDAEDLFNVTCDLKLVCEKLSNQSQCHKRQDIEVGKPVRPQSAKKAANASAAWKKLHGKEVVVECKFDGDRIQIHKNGPEVHFFSRNFLDHPEYEHAMSDVIEKSILVDRCILDGEMLVWDTSLNRFSEFGSNQEIAKAAREGLDSERQMCYVAFDVLYVGDTSVIHQSLKERHELLSKVVKPLKGRLEILIPNGGGLNASLPAGEPCWSRVAYNVDDVERFFKETIENRDEGIVLKDLGSKWEPGDRSGRWLKIKPDYNRAGSDLDVLIIGGYYGSGRHGGEVAQFLVALAERPTPNTYPRRFVSFCRVGTGLSDNELDAVVSKLKPYFRKNEYPKKSAPSFYQVTNNSKERPDVWIDSPEKSMILSITSDIRTVKSEVFSAPYSLRFPRIDRVREDKAWHECLDVQSFVELVHSSNGTTQKGTDFNNLQANQLKRVKSSRREKRNLSNVPNHFTKTDVASVKEETLIFSNMMFYFVNVPSSHSLDSLHKLIVVNGGTFSMNLNSSVTHCVAAESKGIKFQAAKNRGDIIRYTWVLDCCEQRKLNPLHPKHFMLLSELSKKKLQEDIDEFCDPYFLNVEISDLKLLLENIDRSEDSKILNHYKQKHCPKQKWSRFQNCHIYFHISTENSGLDDILGLARKRMELEVSVGGGKIASSLPQATHLILLSMHGLETDTDFALRSFSKRDRDVISKKRMHLIGLQWLEEFLTTDQYLQDVYSGELDALEESNPDDMKSDINHELPSGSNTAKEESLVSSIREVKCGRGKTDSSRMSNKRRKENIERSSKRGRKAVSRPRQTRVRARLGKKAVKISEIVSDNDDSQNETENEDMQQGGENYATPKVECQSSEVRKENSKMGHFESLKGSMVSRSESPIAKDHCLPSEVLFPKVFGTKNDCEEKKEDTEKLEVMVDPLQAMLFDMIPSLGPKWVHMVNSTKASSIVADPTKPSDCYFESTEAADRKALESSLNCSIADDPTADTVFLGEQPTKKRKFSYKDVAFELQKD
ncbi:hypothetical protein QQ045_029610 [Rhodiola kirilowii]